MNDYHAPAALVRRHANKVSQGTHLIDGNLLAGFLAGFGFFTVQTQHFRLQQTEIRVRVLPEPVTRRTFSTSEFRFVRMLAQQTLGEIHRQIELADALGSLEQQTMQRTLAQFLQARPVVSLPRINIFHIILLR